jgi:hypothetical protein
MKKIIFSLLICISIFSLSCKNNSDTVTNGTNPPVTTPAWSMIYEEKAWGTFNCTMPNFCLYDIVTDSLDLRNTDTVRVLLYYRSYHNTSMALIKVPYPVQMLAYTFPDSTIGKVDTILNINFNAKVLFDFGFEVQNKFTIDTLKVYKKNKTTL